VVAVSGSGPVYVQWGLISITAANLVVLGLMILVFAAAVALRLPEGRGDRAGEAADQSVGDRRDA
jgi:hypothetical protein